MRPAGPSQSPELVEARVIAPAEVEATAMESTAALSMSGMDTLRPFAATRRMPEATIRSLNSGLWEGQR